MSNKKGQGGVMLVILLLITLVIIGIVYFWSFSYQKGTSKDMVQGYDEGILWHHAYLKNDHNTAYCFDDERFIPILEHSQKADTEVIISYEKYFIKGSLCSAASNYETVVITNIEEINGRPNSS